MLGQQRRVHPRLGVPEDVSVVAVGGEPSGRHAPVDTVPRARPKVELAGVHVGGQRRVAEHLDPSVPQRRPRRVVGGQQRRPAGVGSRGGLALSGADGVGRVLGALHTDVLGDRVGLTGSDREGELLAHALIGALVGRSVGRDDVGARLKLARQRRLDVRPDRLDCDPVLVRGRVPPLRHLVGEQRVVGRVGGPVDCVGDRCHARPLRGELHTDETDELAGPVGQDLIGEIGDVPVWSGPARAGGDDAGVQIE